MSTPSWQARDRQVLWHPYTQHGRDNEPLAIAAAAGATLKTEDGRELIDAISSWWATLHGHGQQELVDAMAAQARTLDHVLFAGATHEPAIELAEQLREVAPAGLCRTFFSDNGSTAIEVALKMAYHSHLLRGAPQRTRFLALEAGYHGDTFGAMAVGDPVPFFAAYAPFLFEVERVPADSSAITAAIDRIGDQLCAVLLEPLVQGAAGMRMHRPAVLRAARDGCDRTGALLIADEVMTGFGRTGKLFACNHADVAPDLLCLAKGLTGGIMPLAATLSTEDVYEAFVSANEPRFFPHGHTFTAHPIACAVALASLRLCRDNDVPQRLESIGARIRGGLAPIENHPRVANLRQLGGITALDIRPRPGDASGYLADIARDLRRRSIAAGVLLRPLGNVLYAMPPACVTDAQCDQIAATMQSLVEDLP